MVSLFLYSIGKMINKPIIKTTMPASKNGLLTLNFFCILLMFFAISYLVAKQVYIRFLSLCN